ncbi:hypothetical protein BDZ89DRAFT_1057262 [Hymenopellis radicata]|nr:hypothetical protein BDZ89DRAFT_1057262 [Hymenopellis radicata]
MISVAIDQCIALYNPRDLYSVDAAMPTVARRGVAAPLQNKCDIGFHPGASPAPPPTYPSSQKGMPIHMFKSSSSFDLTRLDEHVHRLSRAGFGRQHIHSNSELCPRSGTYAQNRIQRVFPKVFKVESEPPTQIRGTDPTLPVIRPIRGKSCVRMRWIQSSVNQSQIRPCYRSIGTLGSADDVLEKGAECGPGL